MIWPRLRRRARLPAHACASAARAPHFDSAQAVVLAGRGALAGLHPGVSRSLSHEFQAQALSARLCPALMDDGSVALFALAGHVGSDQADELMRRVAASGYRLSQPARYVLDAPLLLALSRDELAGAPRAGPGRAHSPSALAAAFQELVEWGVRHHASDLHLNLHLARPESEVKYTIGGRYVAPERFCRMPTAMLNDMLAVVWMDIRGGNGALFDPHVEQQGSLLRQVDGCDVVLRWASLAAEAGPSVCLRLLVRDARLARASLAGLGYLPDQVACIQRAMQASGGAIVFSGAVGSGKSTTLASLVAGLPAHRKLISLEDPVEYPIANAIQNSVARTLDGSQPQAFAAKLRTLKRSAMTDVLLGEVRDRESGRAFMDLASAGVNVYTTVHAPSAAAVPGRLASDFIAISRDLLLTPGLLRLIVHQALLPRLCAHCCLRPDARLQAQLRPHLGPGAGGARLRNPQGCARCAIHGLDALRGYAGRTVAAEIIEPALQPGFLDAVRSGGGAGVGAGWQSAMDSAIIKACAGQLDPRDIEPAFQSFETRRLQQRLAARALAAAQP